MYECLNSFLVVKNISNVTKKILITYLREKCREISLPCQALIRHRYNFYHPQNVNSRFFHKHKNLRQCDTSYEAFPHMFLNVIILKNYKIGKHEVNIITFDEIACKWGFRGELPDNFFQEFQKTSNQYLKW